MIGRAMATAHRKHMDTQSHHHCIHQQPSERHGQQRAIPGRSIRPLLCLLMTPWLSGVLISAGEWTQSAAPEQQLSFAAGEGMFFPSPLLCISGRSGVDSNSQIYFRPVISWKSWKTHNSLPFPNQIRRFGELKIEMKTVIRCFAFPVVFVGVIESERQQKMRMTKWQTWPDVTIHENIRKFSYTATLLMNVRYNSRNVKMD